MFERTVRVLLVEDSPSDALIVCAGLRTGGPGQFEVTHVESLREGLQRLSSADVDVVLLDLGLPDSQGFDTLAAIRRRAARVPIVVLTGHDNETLGMQVLKDGAQDYLVKGQVSNPMLARAIRYAIERKRNEEALRDSEERYRLIVENQTELILKWRPDGTRTAVNSSYCRYFGVRQDDCLGTSFFSFLTPSEREALVAKIAALTPESPQSAGETLWINPAGEHRWQAWNDLGTFDAEGRLIEILSIGRDITKRKRAEEARERLVAILESTTDFVGTCDAEGRALYLNRAGRRLCGIAEKEDVTGMSLADFCPDWARVRVLQEAMPAAVRDGAWSGETALVRRNHEEFPVSQVILAHKSPMGHVDYFSTIIRDLSEYKRLQEQFLHAQKMEAVGRLAGGIAHDFNNLLTVIRGYGESLLASVDANSSANMPIREIIRAATMAATLTRQLLTFSRRDASQLVALDLNPLLTNMETMLRRLIPENIVLKTVRDPNLRPVMADAAQIQQVILNLAVNARDAMPGGGLLAIETANVDLDEASRQPTDAPPGPYSLLTVTDTGCGMDAQTQALIFEPFFTTKPKGKGSGLGLATVFGIVKQSGGFIRVLSEIGCGSTFKVYLPSVAHEAAARAPSRLPSASVGGKEVILLVEDEARIRVLIRTILQKAGYTVLEARPGDDALRLAARHEGRLSLLITDAQAPGIALARELARQRPDLKVLFSSANACEGREEWPAEATVLPRPFEPEALLRTVRAVLDRQLQMK
jgi:PAS domain S-box-containing protein